jgi:two-component system response regulator AtoC
MVLCDGDTIGGHDLPERLRKVEDPIATQMNSAELSIKKTSRLVESVLIRRALEQTRGNRTRAAELLEISHRALLYKLKDYGITDL